MDDKNARLTMRLVPVTANSEPSQYMKLVVEDAVSGLTIIEMELLGEHLLDMLGNRQVGGVDGLEAWLLPEPLRSNLGRKRGITRRLFPMRDHEEEDVRDWCAYHGPALGAVSWTVSRQNTGSYNVAWYHYFDMPDDQLKAVLTVRQDTMDMIPEPARKS